MMLFIAEKNIEFTKKQQNLATLTQNTFHLEIIHNVIINKNTMYIVFLFKRETKLYLPIKCKLNEKIFMVRKILLPWWSALKGIFYLHM